MVRALPDRGRGHPDRGDAGRHRLDLGDLPRISGECRAPAEGHQLRHVYRALGVAHVRDGPARARGARPPRTICAGWSRRSRRRCAPARSASRPRGRRRMSPRTRRRSPAASPIGQEIDRLVGAMAAARRRDLPDRPRHFRRRGAARVSRATAPGRARERPADHVRHARHPAGRRPEPVGLPDPLYGRDRGGRRAHVSGRRRPARSTPSSR